MKRDHSKLQFRMWDDAACEKMMNAVYGVLEKSGCLIKNEEARELLGSSGAEVEGELVRIPRKIIKDAIASAPKSFTLYDQTGKPAMQMDTEHTYIGPPISTVYAIDAVSGERKTGERADAYHAGLVCDALPNIAWSSAMSGIADGVSSLSSLYEVYELLRSTNKTVMYWASDMMNLNAQMEMFRTVAGGREAFREKPFAMCLLCPMDPLQHNDDTLEQILYLAKEDAVIFYVPGTQFGVTAPVTLAGSILIGLADTLTGLAVAQLAHPGCRFIVSRYCNTMDMRTMTIQNAHPEMLASHIAASDVFRYIGLPFAVNLGDTDGSVFNEAFSFDLGSGVYTGLLSGATMVMGCGGIDYCLTADSAAMMLCSEAADYYKIILRGVDMSEEEMALDDIEEVGPGGNYVMQDSTLERCYDFWKPDAMQPLSWGRKGKADVRGPEEIYRERIRKIVEAGPVDPKDEAVRKKLDEILSEAERSAE